MRRFALAAVLVVIGTAGSVAHGEAAGNPTWTVQTTPTPNVPAEGGELVGVSCPSSSDCVAVGWDVAFPLSETWNGAKWIVRPISAPPGALGGQLQAVSCPTMSMSGCITVGAYTQAGTGNGATLAERWTGGHWVIQPMPATAGGTDGNAILSGIDCLKTNDCTAVGTDGFANSGQSAGLVEQWNGSTWAVVPSPTLPGFNWTILNSVSCSSRTACVAVGSTLDLTSNNQTALAEGWNGAQWTMLTLPVPAGATESDLGSVSCAPASGCVAVGTATIAGTDIQSLAEGWDGSQWTIEPMPSLNAPELNGVSCPAPGECTAVGSYNTSSNNTAGEPLAEAWNGTAWSVESAPLPKGRTVAWLWGASCVSTISCEAVGFSLDKDVRWHTLAEGATG
jgi:hypothetical protein